MLPEWLDQVIENRIEKTLEESFFVEQDKLFALFMESLTGINNDKAIKLEAYFYSRTKQALSKGYEMGMTDMKELIK